MSKTEEIARETLVACDIEDDCKVYGRHDLYNAKDVIEVAVDVALEWAAQQCESHNDEWGPQIAPIIRAGKSKA